MSHERTSGFQGPRLWVIVAIIAAAIGALVGAVTPVHPYTPGPESATPRHIAPESLREADAPRRVPAHSAAALDARNRNDDHAQSGSHHAPPDIPAWLIAPFVALLASIALLPFLASRFWNTHYPAVAFALGAFVLAFYLAAFGEYGREQMLHSGFEYFQFIGLVGSLFVATGGIVFRVHRRGSPVVNAAVLLAGAMLANVIGTAGASILLIRPFMQINKGRLRPLHIVFFIFIVSNCGGALTPIGDPPLYLGFLKGIPFFWTLAHLWQEWLVCIGLLLAAFLAVDLLFERADIARAAREPDYAQRLASFTPTPGPIASIRGAVGIACLVLIVLAVFIDPLLANARVDTHGIPVAPIVQLVIAFIAYKGAKPEYHAANEFNFHPVQEVAYLFAGIFLTMAPALGYLAINGPMIGLQIPSHYYFATGALSAVLDNAPTYLNFLQAALATEGYPLALDGIREFIAGAVVIERDGVEVVVPGALVLAGISLGAVFFGAATYIGNAPNFMVKAIAEADGVRMPGFLGYLRYSVTILLPILVVVWLVFLRL